MKSDVNWGSSIDEQFIRQANWTSAFRYQVYRNIKLHKTKNILEIGCGTGVITQELRDQSSASIIAIDIDEEMLSIAEKRVQNVEFMNEDAHKLPFRDNHFDVIISHYVFLWIDHPLKAITEMKRVCKKNGFVVALAEPDYGAWVEYPDLSLGKNHIKCLKKEGADPNMGRKLLHLFESVGLDTQISIIAQTWSKKNLLDNIEEEWMRVLEADLISQKEYDEIIKQEKSLIKKNQRMIFIPVFMALGRK